MEAVRILRNIFFRTFVVALGLFVVFDIVTIMGWDAMMSIPTRLFHTDAATLTTLTLQFFTALKFVVWFGLLTPALALHWTLKAEEKRSRLSGERTI